MKEYLDEDLFYELKDSMIYLERTQADGRVREGLMGMVDLEDYSYEKGSQTLIRATEKTVIERIPPRLKVRENALLELPHIMILIDDEKKKIPAGCRTALYHTGSILLSVAHYLRFRETCLPCTGWCGNRIGSRTWGKG